MIAFPNAKINIGLKILGKRPDGFHDIETILYPIALSDILEIVPSSESHPTFTSSGLDIPGDPSKNLCLKAFQLLSNSFHLPPVNIHLHKMIPIGAGLGGGSSDGAYTVKMLNELFSLGLTDDEMMGFAGKLGSDCPFFIKNRPVFAYGKGDHFIPTNLHLSGYRIELISPSVFVNTAEAYRLVDQCAKECFPGPASGLQDHIEKPITEWRDLIYNDFETPIFSQYPELEAIKLKLYNQGAIYASLTGSGSTLFGIFRESSVI
jgi:4-diphosphocytidyl-2-C-methyl-D-erythritol kinase